MRAARDDGSALETFFARLLVDDRLHAEFLAGAEATARRHRLSSEEARSIAAIDRDGLELARRSSARKRQAKAHHERPSLIARVLRRLFRAR